MVNIGWNGQHKEKPQELLPPVPLDMGGWIAWVTPAHPAVALRSDAKDVLAKYEHWRDEILSRRL